MKRALVVGAMLLAAVIAVSALALTRPDPVTQAAADGCTGSGGEMLTAVAPSWVYVNDKDAPAAGPPPVPQWVHGVVNSPLAAFGTHPSQIDNPVVHNAYDVNINVLPDAADSALLGTHNLVGEGETVGRIHTEREQASFPTFAWPEPGDRVAIFGNWIWDCVHDQVGGVRSEIHPLRAIWVQRTPSPRSPAGENEGDLFISTDKTAAGKQEDCAHKAKTDRAAFAACLKTEPDWASANGTYTFTLPAPKRPLPGAKLTVRVVDQGSVGAPAVTATPGANNATVSVTVSAPTGRRVVVAKQIFVGWTGMPKPLRLHVSFDRLLVRRAMDPGCPGTNPHCTSLETTRPGQISASPGEWLVYVDVGGIWSQWPGVLRVRDGQVVSPKQSVDLYVPAAKPWRVFVFTRECDFGVVSASDPTRPPAPCPKTGEFADLTGDDNPGTVLVGFGAARKSLGSHTANSSFVYSSCPPVNTKGCYAITFSVTRR